MTNKEKIRELARKHQGTMTDAQYIQMQYALEDMCEWKEEQMVEKVIEWLKDQKEMIGVSFEDDFYIRFKQAMKQQKSGC